MSDDGNAVRLKADLRSIWAGKEPTPAACARGLGSPIIRNMSKFEDNTERFAALLKALGNTNRLAVLRRLAACCPPGIACATEEARRVCVGDLGEGLDIAPSTLSHHLKELNRLGLVRMARRGKRTECWVDPATLEELAAFFAGLTPLQPTVEEKDE